MKRFFLFAITLFLMLFFTVSVSGNDGFSYYFPPFYYKGQIKEPTEGFTVGETVTLLEGEHEKYYIIRMKNGGRRRIPWSHITPLPKTTTSLPAVSHETIAYFAGEKGLCSKTDFLVWTDLSRFKTYVLEYGDEGWQVLRVLPCAVGDAAHPTPSGTYEVAYKCACIGKEELYLCRHALCFYGGYMYHSVLLSWGGDAILDKRLGAGVSHGCIRHTTEDSLWLYQTVPVGTTVYIR